MNRWEYMELNVNEIEASHTVVVLNKLGADGWELLPMWSDLHGWGIKYFLKRQTASRAERNIFVDNPDQEAIFYYANGSVFWAGVQTDEAASGMVNAMPSAIFFTAIARDVMPA